MKYPFIIIIFTFVLHTISGFTLVAQSAETDSLKSLLNEETSDTVQVRLLLKLAGKYTSSDLNELAYYATRALKLSTDLKYDFGMADANRFLGVLEFRKSNIDSAEVLFRKSYKIFEKLNMPSKQSILLYQIGLTAFRKSEYAEAIKRFNRLIEFAELHDDDAGKSKAYLLLGIIYKNQGDPVRAIDYYQKSLTIEEALKNKNIQSMLYNNLSTLFYALNERENALEYLKKSLSLIDSSENTLHRANVIRNIGIGKWNLGLLEEALVDFRTCHRILIDINEVCHQSGVLNSIGNYFSHYEQYDSALFYANRSLKITSDCNDQEQQCTTLNGIGITQKKINLDDKAITSFKRSYKISSELGLVGEKKIAALNLYEIYKSRNNYRSAIRFLEEYHAAKDTMLNEKNTKQITKLESRFKFEKEKELLVLEQEKQELSFQNQLEEERFIKYMSFVVLFFVSALAYILFRYYSSKSKDNKKLSTQNELIMRQSEDLRVSSGKEKELLNNQIRLKERELATMAMHANEKNSILSNIESTLESMKLNKENLPQLKQIKDIIANNIKKEDSWDSFLHRFEDIYPDFFEHLKLQFANLSLNELKLCGYIKIGMSNNEIMQVTNVANSTVKKSLNRLKKKLTLGPEDSIRDYLIKYA